MKKIIAILLVAACFTACKEKAATDQPGKDSVDVRTDSLPEKPVGEYIPLPLAKEMVAKHTKAAAGSSDYTKSIWYDIDEIEALVKTIKASKGTGFRIYLANNPDTAKVDPNRSTVILIGTYTGADGVQYDEISPAPKTLKHKPQPPGDPNDLKPYNHGDTCPNPNLVCP